MSDVLELGHAEVITDSSTLTRDDWLIARRRGIGGSDVSAIVGLSQYQTPLSVWLDKTGIYTPEDAPSEAMEWGNLLEPIVADEFSKRSGVPTVPYRFLLAHPEHEWMLANVDRVIPSDPTLDVHFAGIYEGKTTSPWNRKDWGTDSDPKVPDHAALQAHHYMAVTGLPYAYVAVLIGGQSLLWRRIECDQDLIDRLILLEHEFWLRVENMDPPAPVERDSELLGDIWTPTPESTITVTSELVDALAARDAAKAAEKEAKRLAAEAEARIKLALEDREYVVDGDGRVLASWREIAPTEVKAYTRAGYRRFLAHQKKEGA